MSSIETARQSTRSALERILVVEDDTSLQSLLRLALEERGGYVVETCNGGREALDKAPVFAPDLILLDVMMPEIDGPQTLARLRRLDQTASTPVIFLTARVRQEDVESYKQLGVYDVIHKPFDPVLLPRTVQNIWDYYQYQVC